MFFMSKIIFNIVIIRLTKYFASCNPGGPQKFWESPVSLALQGLSNTESSDSCTESIHPKWLRTPGAISHILSTDWEFNFQHHISCCTVANT